MNTPAYVERRRAGASATIPLSGSPGVQILARHTTGGAHGCLGR